MLLDLEPENLPVILISTGLNHPPDLAENFNSDVDFLTDVISVSKVIKKPRRTNS